MSEGFTRYQLRQRLETLGIAVRYGQFSTYIDKGLLPDPEEVSWVEAEIVPRMLRIHELEPEARSLDRRVVVLAIERYPVPTVKLREAMAGMLPTIERPARKMNRVIAAGRWFGSRESREATFNKGQILPGDWKPPARAEWPEVLRTADLAVFENRLNLVPYYTSLLATLGKGTPHDLSDMDPAERLTLMMVSAMAAWHWHQQRGREARQ